MKKSLILRMFLVVINKVQYLELKLFKISSRSKKSFSCFKVLIKGNGQSWITGEFSILDMSSNMAEIKLTRKNIFKNLFLTTWRIFSKNSLLSNFFPAMFLTKWLLMITLLAMAFPLILILTLLSKSILLQ